MVLMRKDGDSRYVADAHVDSFRKLGYVVDGEEAPEVEAPVDEVEPKADEESNEVAEEVTVAEDEEKAEKFACPHCGKEYATETNLNKHIAKEHSATE